MRIYKHITRRVMLLLVALSCVASAFAWKGRDDVSKSFPYVFILEDGSMLPAQISDEEFYTNAQGIVFPVNKFYIPNGNAWLKELKEKVEPWSRTQGYELKFVELRGASSPEGPIKWNNTLAKNRSIALRDTLQSIFVVDYDLINPNATQHPEDYKALVFMMRQNNDPDLVNVEYILEKYENDRVMIKKELKRINNGKLWKRLLKEYFPNIRYARVLLYFVPKKPFSVEGTLNQELTDEEAYRMLHEKYPYVFILPPGETKAPRLSDDFYYSNGHGIIFPVNKYNLPENDEWLEELTKEVAPWAKANNMKLRNVDMRGASSPDGPILWNNTLAEYRSKVLQDTLKSIFNIDYDIVDSMVVQAPEDYKALLHLMRKANDHDLKIVEDILNKDNYDRIRVKRDLKAANGGKLWARLLKEYFPQIRYARVYLFFSQDLPEEVDTIATPEITPEETITYPPEPVRMPRRELLSVKTNLLFDLAYMPFGYKDFCPIPNVAIEYYPLHGHFTYGAMFDCPWWQGDITNHKYFQVRNYTVESRYYFRSGDVNKRGIGNGAAFKGAYLSAYAHAGLYAIGWSDKKGFDGPGSKGGHGWEGEGAGAGLGFGYVMPLSKNEHWRLELSAQFGFFHTKYDPYIYGCPVEHKNDGLYYYVWYRDADEFKERQHRFNWLGPTRVSIQVSYDLLYRQNKKHKASFKAWEKGGGL